MPDAQGFECVHRDPDTGVSTWIKPDGDGMIVQTRQDVSAILDANMAERNMARPGWKGDYHRVASIPSVLAYEPGNPLFEAMQAQDTKFVKKVLNDGDFSKLRTKDGNL